MWWSRVGLDIFVALRGILKIGPYTDCCKKNIIQSRLMNFLKTNACIQYEKTQKIDHEIDFKK